MAMLDFREHDRLGSGAALVRQFAVGESRTQFRLKSLIMSILGWLLDPTGLTAHGFCLSWAPGLVALHAASDMIIGLAYFSIPLALFSFVRRRADLGRVLI